MTPPQKRHTKHGQRPTPKAPQNVRGSGVRRERSILRGNREARDASKKTTRIPSVAQRLEWDRAAVAGKRPKDLKQHRRQGMGHR